jgi:hypothetical protein
MVKNILISLSLFVAIITYLQSRNNSIVYENVISKQRTQIDNLNYQINQCKILYIGL